MNAPRRSPWHDAPDELKLSKTVGPYSALIVNLTPDRNNIRLGILVNDRETSIVIPFARAQEFFREVEALIQAKKGH